MVSPDLRQDAKGAKVKRSRFGSSWRSLRLGDRKRNLCTLFSLASLDPCRDTQCCGDELVGGFDMRDHTG